MTTIQPIVIYGARMLPNVFKVIIILEELKLPYTLEPVDMGDIKKEPYISLNPNGRLPSMKDPNTGIILWESGAIIDYVIDKYDPNATLHYTTEPEKYQQRSWEHFQMSGQGPYLGQRMWFDRYHAEFFPSAVDRYTNEAKRVVGVIDAHLQKKGTEFLVGDKPCFADFMFVPWFSSLTAAVVPGLDTSEWPHYNAWLARLYAREGTASALAKHVEASKEWKPAPSRSAAQN